MNKLGANITTIGTAEKMYTRLQQNQKSNGLSSVEQEGLPSRPAKGAHIDIAG